MHQHRMEGLNTHNVLIDKHLELLYEAMTTGDANEITKQKEILASLHQESKNFKEQLLVKKW